MARGTRMLKLATVASALAISAEADAASIYGIIQQGNQPVRNTPVILICDGTEAARATTDDRGRYRLTASRTGGCSLRVGRASGEVILYQDPTRYNFDTVGTQLIRR
jgi:hypothetical protein